LALNPLNLVCSVCCCQGEQLLGSADPVDVAEGNVVLISCIPVVTRNEWKMLTCLAPVVGIDPIILRSRRSAEFFGPRLPPFPVSFPCAGTASNALPLGDWSFSRRRRRGGFLLGSIDVPVSVLFLVLLLAVVVAVVSRHRAGTLQGQLSLPLNSLWSS
jgi:hypothetical protein